MNPQDFGSLTIPALLHWPLGVGEGVIGDPFSGVQGSSSVFSVSGTLVPVEPFETVIPLEPSGTVVPVEAPSSVPRKSSVSILQTMAPPRPIFLANRALAFIDSTLSNPTHWFSLWAQGAFLSLSK